MTPFDQARWTFADAAVLELRKGYDHDVYAVMMQALGSRDQQNKWANARGHRWDASGRFIKAGDP